MTLIIDALVRQFCVYLIFQADILVGKYPCLNLKITGDELYHVNNKIDIWYSLRFPSLRRNIIDSIILSYFTIFYCHELYDFSDSAWFRRYHFFTFWKRFSFTITQSFRITSFSYSLAYFWFILPFTPQCRRQLPHWHITIVRDELRNRSSRQRICVTASGSFLAGQWDDEGSFRHDFIYSWLHCRHWLPSSHKGRHNNYHLYKDITHFFGDGILWCFRRISQFLGFDIFCILRLPYFYFLISPWQQVLWFISP